ncbi:MAG: 16S rRNA methyltransferase [Archaeoglobaceae archaeon]
MPRIVFVEASLELVPKAIAGHPAVVADARRRRKKPTEIILDDSKHHAAMKGLMNREKRGRPDIIHGCLLLFLDSPIAKDFEIYVHTVGGDVIWVSSEVRLPRNYNRFIGVMEDLFKKRRIEADGKVLLEITDLKFEDLLKGKVIVLHENGKAVELEELMKGEFTVCVGAFAHGDFGVDFGDAEFVSIGGERFTSLYATCRVVSAYERARSA